MQISARSLLSGLLAAALISGSVPAGAFSRPLPGNKLPAASFQTQAIPAAIIFGTLAPLIADAVPVRQLIHTVFTALPLAAVGIGMAFSTHLQGNPAKSFPYPWYIQLDLPLDKRDPLLLKRNPDEPVDEDTEYSIWQLVRFFSHFGKLLPRGIDGIVLLAPQTPAWTWADREPLASKFRSWFRYLEPYNDGVLFSVYEGKNLIVIPFNRIPKYNPRDIPSYAESKDKLWQEILRQASYYLNKQTEPPTGLAAWPLFVPYYRFVSRFSPIAGWVAMPALLETAVTLDLALASGNLLFALGVWQALHAFDLNSPRFRFIRVLNPRLIILTLYSWGISRLVDLSSLELGIVLLGIHLLVNLISFADQIRAQELSRDYHWERVRRSIRGIPVKIPDELMPAVEQLAKISILVKGVLTTPKDFPQARKDFAYLFRWLSDWSLRVPGVMPIPLWVFPRHVRKFIKNIFTGGRMTFEGSLTDMINVVEGTPEFWTRFWGWRKVQLHLQSVYEKNFQSEEDDSQIPHDLKPLTYSLTKLMIAVIRPATAPKQVIYIDNLIRDIETWTETHQYRWGVPPWKHLPLEMRSAILGWSVSSSRIDREYAETILKLFKDAPQPGDDPGDGTAGGSAILRYNPKPSDSDGLEGQRFLRRAI